MVAKACGCESRKSYVEEYGGCESMTVAKRGKLRNHATPQIGITDPGSANERTCEDLVVSSARERFLEGSSSIISDGAAENF